MNEAAYKETKICQCICCGDDVTVTKFASAAKVVCKSCKESGAQPDMAIVSSAKTKNIEPRAKYDGATKILPCTKCGNDVEVTKFASASKVICDECKGESGGYAQHGEIILNPVINLKKLDRNVVPTLDEYRTTPELINNVALRNVRCPACNHEYMKILKVMDWSTFGLVLHYQCTKCKLLVSVSEQSKRMVKYNNDGEIFDYSGEVMSAGASAIGSSRMSMAVMKLMGILKEHDITIDGDELPPYIHDEVRPVPVGYRIPDGDREIKAIDNAISLLMRLRGSHTPEEFMACVADSNTAIDGLKLLFKEGQ